MRSSTQVKEKKHFYKFLLIVKEQNGIAMP